MNFLLFALAAFALVGAGLGLPGRRPAGKKAQEADRRAHQKHLAKASKRRTSLYKGDK